MADAWLLSPGGVMKTTVEDCQALVDAGYLEARTDEDGSIWLELTDRGKAAGSEIIAERDSG